MPQFNICGAGRCIPCLLVSTLIGYKQPMGVWVYQLNRASAKQPFGPARMTFAMTSIVAKGVLYSLLCYKMVRGVIIWSRSHWERTVLEASYVAVCMWYKMHKISQWFGRIDLTNPMKYWSGSLKNQFSFSCCSAGRIIILLAQNHWEDPPKCG